MFAPRNLCGDGLPKTGAIEVDFDTVVPREGGDGLTVCHRKNLAAEGIFEGDEAGWRMVDIVVEDGMRLYIPQRKTVTVGRDDTSDQGTTETGYSAGFPFEDMGSVVAEDRVRGLGEVGADGDLISHGAGEDKESSGKAGELCDVGFEGICGRVFDEDVVKEGSVLDGGEHGSGRGSDNITYWTLGRNRLKAAERIWI